MTGPLGWFDPNLVLTTFFEEEEIVRAWFDPEWVGVTLSDTITETATATDTDSSTVDFVSSDSEAASASDTTSSAVSFAPTITETASATDTDTSAANFVSGISVSEAGSAADTTNGPAEFVSSVTESASGVDTTDGPINYVSGIADTEAGSATDTIAGSVAFVVTVSEAGSTSDAVDANGNFIASGSELASANDTITSQTDFVSDISEAVSASDTTDGPTDYLVSVDEAAFATDLTLISIEVPVSEAATANDATNGTASFTCVVNEAAIAITTSDGTIVTHAIDVSIAELVTATESSSAEITPPLQIVINNSIPVPVVASTIVNTPITPFYLQTISSTFSPDLVTYTVTTPPAFGILLEDGMAFASNPIQFSQADLNSGRVSYQNTLPTTLDEFDFQVSQPAAFALQRIRFADSNGQSLSGSVQISVNARTIQIVGDKDTGDGLIETPSQDFYKVSGKLISVDTTAVTDHPPGHTNVKTANGASFFHINGKPVNFKTNADTCGHTRNGDEANWFNVG